MPELPEVETVVKALGLALPGREVIGVRFLGAMRLPFDEALARRLLRGRAIVGVRRRAKYIVIDLDGPSALLAHLGMTGHFRVEAESEPRARHDRVVFSLRGGDELRYADARRFGFVVPAGIGPDGWPAELSGLGVEPLERAFSGRAMLDRAAGRSCPVKNFIMDQAVVVGVGNIYASEALWGARVDPRRPAGDLDGGDWDRLVASIKKVLRKAIRQGGSTIRNYRTVDGSEGGFQRSLNVYGKAGEACPACGSAIMMVRQGGRSSFFCPKCQD